MAIINSYPTVTPENADLVILTDTSTTPNSTKTATVGSISTLVNKGFTSYVAKITQSGSTASDAPVATVLNNDTGLTPTWSRSNTGDYRLSGLLASANTHFIQITGGNSASPATATTLLVKSVNPSEIQIINLKLVDGQPADGVTLGFIEVRKYS